MKQQKHLLKALQQAIDALHDCLADCLLLRDDNGMGLFEKNHAHDPGVLAEAPDDFWLEMSRDIQMRLLADDPDYVKLTQTILACLQDNPLLLTCLSQGNTDAFSETTHEALETLCDACCRKSSMEMEEAYIKGHQDCLNYLIGINVLPKV